MVGSFALCDHGNLLDQYGQREYWVERPGWFFKCEDNNNNNNNICALLCAVCTYSST